MNHSFILAGLETTLTEQREDADMARHELQELIRDKTDIIRHKDAVIEQLQLRMDQMSDEFQTMLEQILKSMKVCAYNLVFQLLAAP